MGALDYIRLIGKEFDEMEDEAVNQWIEMVGPMVSRKQFGKLYEQAIAYLVCHEMKLGGNGESPLGGLADTGSSMAVGSISDGGTSVSFTTSAGSLSFLDAELTLTRYGVQFLQLRKLCVMPIHIRGEWDHA